MTETFDAYDDEGNRYAVRIRRSYINTSDLSGPGRIEGLPSFHLTDGDALNRIGEQTFEVVATGERLRVRT